MPANILRTLKSRSLASLASYSAKNMGQVSTFQMVHMELLTLEIIMHFHGQVQSIEKVGTVCRHKVFYTSYNLQVSNNVLSVCSQVL
jgi:hypothetical protein